MSNVLIVDTNTSLRSSAWHAGLEIAVFPVPALEFLFSFSNDIDLIYEEEFFEPSSTIRRQVISDSLQSDDFAFIRL
jgi:hypothetical protein